MYLTEEKTVERVGYYLPVMLVSAVIAAVGNGLLSTLSPDTTTAMCAGYEIVVGIGRGMSLQLPFIALQSHAPPALAPIATATLVFFQTFGGAVFISAGNALFSNRLREELVARVPQLDADRIIIAGAMGIALVVPPAAVSEVLAAYSQGISAVFDLMIATSRCLFLASWGMGWKDVRKRKDLGP